MTIDNATLLNFYSESFTFMYLFICLLSIKTLESDILLVIHFKPINRNSVLATLLRLSLLAINHFRRFSKSEFTAASRSVIEFPDAVRFVSSAKKHGFVLFRHCGR